ncbi:hypothetical protein FEM48_Zijuj10G0074900 [Ziziphus jujuba var. spinosa]|uniref:Uncharacterized protein n=1 Tax=Ziziphus jujuba var. spinosa TaxID=714518 RepID=A0A978UM42_ZIZJJ|nr:hypothetical protein FEM48_Zijuj10G0074900 [Ziziphus jujuba var. spinosa]
MKLAVRQFYSVDDSGKLSLGGLRKECPNAECSFILEYMLASAMVCRGFFEVVTESLLCDPNPNSPENAEAAWMFSENKHEYNSKVRETVEQSWAAD